MSPPVAKESHGLLGEFGTAARGKWNSGMGGGDRIVAVLGSPVGAWCLCSGASRTQ